MSREESLSLTRYEDQQFIRTLFRKEEGCPTLIPFITKSFTERFIGNLGLSKPAYEILEDDQNRIRVLAHEENALPDKGKCYLIDFLFQGLGKKIWIDLLHLDDKPEAAKDAFHILALFPPCFDNGSLEGMGCIPNIKDSYSFDDITYVHPLSLALFFDPANLWLTNRLINELDNVVEGYSTRKKLEAEHLARFNFYTSPQHLSYYSLSYLLPRLKKEVHPEVGLRLTTIDDGHCVLDISLPCMYLALVLEDVKPNGLNIRIDMKLKSMFSLCTFSVEEFGIEEGDPDPMPSLRGWASKKKGYRPIKNKLRSKTFAGTLRPLLVYDIHRSGCDCSEDDCWIYRPEYAKRTLDEFGDEIVNLCRQTLNDLEDR